ncbi:MULTISPECIES: hypothetical protein [unclassified Pseudoalteromonas]|uniref:hypothetical protein n=1 Tax=unclassified Pseudoalteromonas TaxID=194690 RepID=UPI001600D058|nr:MULTISPECIES: hypothetical protein [unclassified Pseudoalteromonas]MBB1333897.1 hypothetical protein [Pseudoalteromonas sp. SR41-6]MBB1459618.1 hypothetical protein [Pseudoalteromonas sp. SG41-8]
MPAQTIANNSAGENELGFLSVLLDKVQEYPWYAALIGMFMFYCYRIYIKKIDALSAREKLQYEDRKHLREMKIRAHEINKQFQSRKGKEQTQSTNGGSK